MHTSDRLLLTMEQVIQPHASDHVTLLTFALSHDFYAFLMSSQHGTSLGPWLTADRCPFSSDRSVPFCGRQRRFSSCASAPNRWSVSRNAQRRIRRRSRPRSNAPSRSVRSRLLISERTLVSVVSILLVFWFLASFCVLVSVELVFAMFILFLWYNTSRNKTRAYIY